jgi:hypothetical protein
MWEYDIDRKMMMDYWRPEVSGANDETRRRWRRHWTVRALPGLVIGVVIVVLGIADTNPLFLMAVPLGLILAWRSLRRIDKVRRLDSFMPPPVDPNGSSDLRAR